MAQKNTATRKRERKKKKTAANGHDLLCTSPDQVTCLHHPRDLIWKAEQGRGIWGGKAQSSSSSSHRGNPTQRLRTILAAAGETRGECETEKQVEKRTADRAFWLVHNRGNEKPKGGRHARWYKKKARAEQVDSAMKGRAEARDAATLAQSKGADTVCDTVLQGVKEE